MNDQFRYTFSCEEGDTYDPDGLSDVPGSKSVNVAVTFSSMTQWRAVLREFLCFLSNIYGYDVSNSVSFDDPMKQAIIDEPPAWDEDLDAPVTWPVSDED